MRAFMAMVILFSGAWSQAAALDCPMMAVPGDAVDQETTANGHSAGGQGHDHAPRTPHEGHRGHDDSSSHHPASGCGLMMTCAPAALAAGPSATFAPVTMAEVAQVPPMAPRDAFPGFEPPPPRSPVRIS